MSKDIDRIAIDLEQQVHAAAKESRSHIPLQINDAIGLVNQINAYRREYDQMKAFIESTGRNATQFLRGIKNGN